MFRAARLRERNPKRGHGMKTYTTAATGTKFVAGAPGKPSALRVVSDDREVAEISEIGQFEILEFQTAAQLDALIQREMEERSRLGHPAVRAEVISQPGQIPEATEEAPVKAKAADAPRTLEEVAPSDEDDDDLGEDSSGGEDDEDDTDDEPHGEVDGDSEDADHDEEESSDEEEKPAKGPSATKKSKGKKGSGKGRKAKK